jgi:glucosyl-3-phosphoglycerate phosphatase
MNNGHKTRHAAPLRSDLIILRHAQTLSNAGGSWHGENDEGLSAAGRAEAMEAAERLRSTLAGRVAVVLSSDLRRAVESAEILARAAGVTTIEREPMLRERDMGEWRGRSPEEVEVRWPGRLSQWVAGAIGGPPGGETDAEVASRAREALLARWGRKPVRGLMLVVTHGGVIRSLRREAILPNEPVAHLGGHWARIEGRRLTLGEQILLGDPAAQPIT